MVILALICSMHRIAGIMLQLSGRVAQLFLPKQSRQRDLYQHGVMKLHQLMGHLGSMTAFADCVAVGVSWAFSYVQLATISEGSYTKRMRWCVDIPTEETLRTLHKLVLEITFAAPTLSSSIYQHTPESR